jgi:2-keto-4-pentenoate hydratase/2-oxohepta-3-ene-1,7-dioic acid hydratase in catechol pathway
VSAFFPKEDFGDFQHLDFRLDVNGEIRQKGNTSQMIFNLIEILCYLSRFFTVKPGDLIFTGTPEGVARVQAGDRLEGYLQEKKMLDFYIR